MTFLNPSVLIGLAASLIPVILHFINFRKIKKIEFSSLRFLKKLEKNKIRNLKIKQWLLLAIRLLLIVVLVLAFSRPALQTANYLGEDAPKTVIVVLDNSYSMSAEFNGISNFSLSKNYAEKILAECKPYDKIYLILTSPVSVIRGKNAKTLIAKSKIGFVKGDLNLAMKKSSEVLRSEKTLIKNLFIFSDFQKSNLSLETLRNIWGKTDENTKVKFVRFNFPRSGNIAVEQSETENQIFLPGRSVGFSVDLKNTSDNVISKTISLYLNGEKTAQKNLKMNPHKKNRLELFAPLKKAGFNTIKITSEDDALLADNERYTGLFVKDKIKILVTAKNKAEAKFLLYALSDKVSELNKTEFVEPDKIKKIDTDKYDVLFAIGKIDTSTIDAFTKNGKFVVIFPSEKSIADLENALLKMNLCKAKIQTTQSGLEFDKISFSNPLIKDLFVKRKSGHIGSPVLKKFLRIEPLSFCNKIITLENNLPFLCSFNEKKGMIFLFAVPPSNNWSNFPIKPFFAALINRFAMLSASRKSVAENLLAGETYYIDVGKINTAKVKVVTPDKNEYFVSAKFSKNNRNIKFDKTYLPGFYYVFANEKPVDFFTVNVDTKESESKFYGINEIAEITKNKFEILDGNALDEKFLQLNSEGSELWRMFLIFALLLALAEMYVARTSKKDFTELNKRIIGSI